MKARTLTLLVGAVSLVLAACGGGETADQPTDTAPPAAGACLAGDPNCQDTVTPLPGEEPTTDEPPGFLLVSDVVGVDIDGGFALRGYYFDTPEGTFICDLIAESFPPQCGGDRLPLDNSAGEDLGPLQTEQGITWSNDQITVIGEIIDGVFVITPMSD